MSLDTFVSIANALQVSADELLKDSIENTIKVSNHEFAAVIADCNEYEKRVLLFQSSSLRKSPFERTGISHPIAADKV